MKKQILIGTALLTTIIILLVVFSLGTLTLTTFELDNIEMDDNGYYLVEDGQEVEIIIKSNYKYRLYIGTFFINETKYFPDARADSDSIATYNEYGKDMYIVLKYTVTKDVDVLTLSNVEIQSTQFIVLGNKFDYNNKETIKFKFID